MFFLQFPQKKHFFFAWFFRKMFNYSVPLVHIVVDEKKRRWQFPRNVFPLSLWPRHNDHDSWLIRFFRIWRNCFFFCILFFYLSSSMISGVFFSPKNENWKVGRLCHLRKLSSQLHFLINSHSSYAPKKKKIIRKSGFSSYSFPWHFVVVLCSFFFYFTFMFMIMLTIAQRAHQPKLVFITHENDDDGDIRQMAHRNYLFFFMYESWKISFDKYLNVASIRSGFRHSCLFLEKSRKFIAFYKLLLDAVAAAVAFFIMSRLLLYAMLCVLIKALEIVVWSAR